MNVTAARRVKWRRLGAPGFVDATRRRRRVGHVRSGTEERRAYARPRRGASPFRCATGCSNTLLTELKLLANERDVPYQSLHKVCLADRVAVERQRNRQRAKA